MSQIEQLSGKVQIFIIDHEGEFSTLREKFNFVLIGEGGEARPDIRTAGLLANRLLELNASTIFDLSEAFRAHPSHRPAYVHAFLSAMMEAPRNLWHPVLVIVDEAHKYCPEKDEAESSEAMVSVATDGRKRQFCAIWATQRLSKLNKDAAAELLNKAIGGTVLDIDVKRAADDLGFYGDDLRAFKNEIKVIERGNFYVLGQALCTTRTLVKVGEVETHPPQAGRKASAPPPAPEKIKELLPKLADLPKEAEEKARTEADLRAEIRSLKSQLRNAPAKTDERAIEIAVERVREAEKRSWRRRLDNAINARVPLIRGLAKIAKEAAALADIPAPKIDLPEETPKMPAITVTKCAPAAAAPRLWDKAAFCNSQNNDLPIGEKAVLYAVAQYQEGVERDQLSVLSGYKRSSRDAYLARLKQRGCIDERGGKIVSTEAGIAALGNDYEPLPEGEELQRYWLAKLPEGEKKILEVLLQQNGQPIDRDALDEATGYKRSSRDAYLSRLAARRIVESIGRGQVKAAEILFQ